MRPSVRRDKLLPVIFIMLQSVIYGFGNPLTKIAYYSITPLWCLTLRFSLAFVLFAAFFGKEAYLRLRGVRAADYLPAGISAALVFILNNIALNMTSATNVGFIMSLPVVIAPLMAVPILKRRYDIRHLPVQLGALGGIYLLLRKVISWQTPVAFIATVAVISLISAPAGISGVEYMAYNVFGGGLMLGAIFMATDYANSSVTQLGQAIFGIGCGLITVFIRRFGSYPEGVCYSILIMNCTTWLLDKYVRPTIYGALKKEKKEAAK